MENFSQQYLVERMKSEMSDNVAPLTAGCVNEKLLICDM